MPIYCNGFEGGVSTSKYEPIIPGKIHTYYYKESKIGMAVLTACDEEDKGGRIYTIAEKIVPLLKLPDGTFSEESLCAYPHEVLPPGATIPVIFTPDDSDTVTLLFTHASMN